MLSLATATMDYKWMTQNEKAYHANDLELFQKFIIPSACKMNIEKWIICNNTTPHDDNPIISYFFQQNHYNDALPTYRSKRYTFPRTTTTTILGVWGALICDLDSRLMI